MSSASDRVHTRTKLVNGVFVVTLDSPNEKVNSLGKAVMNEFQSIVSEIHSNPQIEAAVIISGKPGCFIAGADISMLEKLTSAAEVTQVSKEGQRLLQQIADSKKPIVAAIQGACLGGGLEVALACHYRIAVKDKKTGLGLPEVMLGLLPGAGGTQRLPKLISLPNALDMALTGRTLKADRAKKNGVVDLLVDPLGPGLKAPAERTIEYLEEVSIQVAKDIATGKLKVDRSKKNLTDKILNAALQYNFVKDKIFGTAKASVMKMSGGLYPAPLKVNNYYNRYFSKLLVISLRRKVFNTPIHSY